MVGRLELMVEFRNDLSSMSLSMDVEGVIPVAGEDPINKIENYTHSQLG